MFSDEQMMILEAAYQKNNHPDQGQRFMVAQLCGLIEERVRIWYQNRRAKEKRQQEDDLAFLAKKVSVLYFKNSSMLINSALYFIKR